MKKERVCGQLHLVMLDNKEKWASFPEGFFPHVSQAAGRLCRDLREPSQGSSCFLLILQVLQPGPGAGCSGYSHRGAQHGCFLCLKVTRKIPALCKHALGTSCHTGFQLWQFASLS